MNELLVDMMRGVYRTVYRPILNTFAPKLSGQFEYLLEDLEESEESFSRKIDDAYDSLRQTSDLLERLEAELDQKIQGVERFRREYERYSELAQVEKGKAQALIEEIDSSLERNKLRERLVAFGISLLAGLVIFVIGVVVGPSLRAWLGIGA